MARYGLAIDRDRCTGCYACVVACKSENSTRPGVSWIRIDEKEQGEFPKVSRTYTPMLCMQCGETPCAAVCPTEAIYKEPTGIVLIDPEKCVCETTKPCIAACPFGVLAVNKGRKSYFPDYLTPEEREGYEAHRDGVVEKCDLCHARIAAGLLPACVQTCPTRAMVFGDLDEPEGELARLLATAAVEPLQAEPKVNPSVLYLKTKSLEP